ncbi:hypothetical protein RAS1_43240 [Phycisphaerae bacterium RAS1]|nr:hypothetical protein RAS1_43240 [Phycisphaerae bacterium RAS1]
MKKQFGLVFLLVASLPVGGTAGCTVLTDFLDADLARGLGLTDTRVNPTGGVIIVQFRNNTNQVATAHATWTTNTAVFTTGGDGFNWNNIGPGDTSNTVIPCPIGLLTFGEFNDDFTINPVAVELRLGDTVTAVTYAGDILVGNSDFECGALIEMTVFPIVGQENAFAISVEVLPGR